MSTMTRDAEPEPAFTSESLTWLDEMISRFRNQIEDGAIRMACGNATNFKNLVDVETMKTAALVVCKSHPSFLDE